MAAPLKIVGVFETSGISRGVQDAVDVAKRGGGAIEAAFKNAGKAVEGAEGWLKSYKREQVQEGRLFGFYAKEIAEFTGMSAKAGGALSEVAKIAIGFATGNFIGSAIDSVKLLAVGWREMGDEGGAAIEKQKKDVVSLTEIIRKQNEELAKGNFLRAGGTEGQWQVTQSKEKADAEETRQEILRVQRRISEYGRLPADRQSHGAAERRAEDIRKDNEKLAELRGKLYRTYQSGGSTYGLDQSDMPIGPQSFAGMGGLGGKSVITPGEVEALDNAGKKAGKTWAAAFAKASREFLLSSWQATQGIDLSRSQGNVLNLMNRRSQNYGSSELGQGATGEAALAAMTGRNRSPEQQAESKKLDKQIADHKKRIDDLNKSYQKLGDVAGRGLADIVSGHRKVGDVAKEVGAQALAMAAKYAVTEILNNSFVAFSKTTAETGGPWGLGLGAMVQGVIAALAGNVVGSAYGGADWSGKRGSFDSRGGFLTVNHPDEMTMDGGLSNYIRKAMRRDAEGGSDSRTSTTLRVVGKRGGLYDLVVEGGRDLARAHKELQRRGVL
jgi:hypothetical protein